MERILTKEEIAELLSAVRDGDINTDIEAEPLPSDKSVQHLDLIRTSLGSGRWNNSNLGIILDAFARNCSISLTSRLQRSVSIKRDAIESDEFDPYTLKIEGNGSIGIIRLDPLSHGGIFVFDTALSYVLVETMMGGTIGENHFIPNRALTAIEMNLIKSALEQACIDLQKAFVPLESLTISLVRIESDPRMVNFVPPDTEMMIIKFTATIDNVSGIMDLAIPYSSLEPLREKIKEGVLNVQVVRKDSWSFLLKQVIPSVVTEVKAQLTELTLPIRDIIDLQEGDIIDLDCDPDSPLRILVEEIPKFFALSGVHNGKKAVRITGKLDKGEHNDNV